MDIVYTNRRRDEARVHIEISAEDAAALAATSGPHSDRLRLLIEEADRRLNPAAEEQPR
ncbi:hypothetical protein [Streptomyces sp. NPDC048445]|uniref:hypothetical protein n=1 Tax=Streptomyces sp. NPDC048445 TaxID=3365553 RepID=UPI003719E0FE